MKGIVTVVGKDKVGIIAEISTELSKVNVNIKDITQTTMENYFTMIMLVDLSEMSVEFNELENLLKNIGEKIHMKIKIQHENIFNSMHKL